MGKSNQAVDALSHHSKSDENNSSKSKSVDFNTILCAMVCNDLTMLLIVIDYL